MCFLSIGVPCHLPALSETLGRLDVFKIRTVSGNMVHGPKDMHSYVTPERVLLPLQPCKHLSMSLTKRNLQVEQGRWQEAPSYNASTAYGLRVQHLISLPRQALAFASQLYKDSIAPSEVLRRHLRLAKKSFESFEAYINSCFFEMCFDSTICLEWS